MSLKKLLEQMDKLSEQGVSEGSGQKYEMMLRNGQVKKFVAKDDADAKRIAAGHGAKSVIKLKGGVPAGKIAEQDVAEAVTDFNPPSQGGTRKELLAKYAKSGDPKHAEAARRAGASQDELKSAKDSKKDVSEGSDKPAHGSPEDRGMADSYYGRKFNPHKKVGGKEIPLSKKHDAEEFAEYKKGYEGNEESGDHKDYGRRDRSNDTSDVKESGLQAYLGNKKYGKEGMNALQQAGREDASKEKMAKIRAKYDKLDEEDMEEGKTGPGLWANIHAKQERIKHGSGERMRKPGSRGAPTAKNFRDAAKEDVEEAANAAQQAAIAIAKKAEKSKPSNLKEWMQQVENEYIAEMQPPSVPGKPNATVVPGVGTITFPIAPGQSMQQGTARAKELGAAVQAGQAVVTTTNSTGAVTVGQPQKPTTTTQPGAVSSMTQSTQVKEEELEEVAPPGEKYERMVLALKKKYPENKGRAYAIAWSAYNKEHGGAKENIKEGTESMQPMDEGKVRLAILLQNYPHEHKMAQEGWGLDEGFYNALCDHYHHTARIPRDVWHGPVSALRGHIEECYMADTVNDPDETALIKHAGGHEVDEGIVGDVGAELGGMVGSAAGSRFGTPGMAVGSVIGSKIGGDIGNKIDTNIVEPLIGEEDPELEEGWKSKAAAGALAAGALLGGGMKAGEYVGKRGNEFINKTIQQGGDTRGAEVKNVELTPPEGQNLPMPAQTPRKKLYRGDLDEQSGLESRLRATTDKMEEELTMESKKKFNAMAEGEVTKTKTGIKNKGHYGKHFDTDEDGDEKQSDSKKDSEPAKRGRGRPRKVGGEAETSAKYSGAKELQSFMVGNLPKGKLPGKPGKKHTLSDKESDKSKKVKESMFQGSLKTARSESPRDAEINNLASRFLKADSSEQKLIKNSLIRLGVTDAEFNQRVAAAKQFKDNPMPSSIKEDIQMESWENQLRSLLEADDPFAKFDDGEADVPVLAMPRGMGMSQQPEDDEADAQVTIVAVGSDEVMDHLDGEENTPMSPDDGGSTLDFIKRMMGARVGKMVADESKEEKAHGHEGHKHAEKVSESAMCEDCSCDPCECDDEDKLDEGNDGNLANNAKPYDKVTQGDVVAGRLGKDEMGGKKVKEGHGEKCSECGGMMEDDHSCEKDAEKLDEWANTSQGRSHDQFITDIDFMTKVISGGLNNMKQDQTTLPSTRVRTQGEQFAPSLSLAELIRKLGDIK
jgi:hypothetical protein